MIHPLVALLTLVCAAFVPAGFADEGKLEGSKRPLTEVDATVGQPRYLRECSACHGERGDGTGPAADYLDPRPRNFTKGQFKFRTTPSGQPPATNDILRVMQRGIPGTAMPSFAFLPEDERRTIAAYVLKLAGLLDEPEPTLAKDPGVPPAAMPETIEKGKQLYVDAGCPACHGKLGRGDGSSAKDLKDVEGRPIKARDFTKDPYRGGGQRVDLYDRLATGLNGTPMPAYGDVLESPDLWALVDYVMSLREPQPATPNSADPIAAGREVATKYSCRGCHVLDDGKGGDVGPDLRVSGQKLDAEWIRRFLKAPREFGHIYPARVYQMPHLGLSDEEAGIMTKYLAVVGKRHRSGVTLPDSSKFPADKLREGKQLFVLRCTECHQLGAVIEAPSIKPQGPDLIRVAHRIDYEWAKPWILNPKHIDHKTEAVVPDLSPEQADAVRMFVWKTSIEAGKTVSVGRNAGAEPGR